MNKNMMKPTVQWMQEKYNEMNRLYFNNKLGDCTFEVFTRGEGYQGNFLGYFKGLGTLIRVENHTGRLYKIMGVFPLVKKYINQSNFAELFKPCIQLNGNYTAPEEGLLNTLVHEMCHYADYMSGIAPKQCHGKSWKNIANYISQKSNGRFNIQRLASAEETKDYILDKDIQQKVDNRINNRINKIEAIISFNDNGNIELTTTSNEEVIKYIIQRCDSVHRNMQFLRGKCIELIRSKDPKLIKFLSDNHYNSNMRKYKYYSIEQDPEVRDFIKDKNYDYTVLYKAQ